MRRPCFLPKVVKYPEQHVPKPKSVHVIAAVCLNVRLNTDGPRKPIVNVDIVRPADALREIRIVWAFKSTNVPCQAQTPYRLLGTFLWKYMLKTSRFDPISFQPSGDCTERAGIRVRDINCVAFLSGYGVIDTNARRLLLRVHSVSSLKISHFEETRIVAVNILPDFAPGL